MTRRRLIEFLRDLARVERYPVLARFHGRTHHSALLTFGRDAVARGVAVGFFFGILTPVAQIVFAIVGAIVLRANIMVAAASTLITNPFILPFVYYFAYRIGHFLTGQDAPRAAEIVASEDAAAHALDVPGWIPALMDWVAAIGFPLVTGVLTLAVITALAGYLLVHLVWACVDLLRR